MFFRCEGDKIWSTCNPNNLQFYGLYLLIKGYILLAIGALNPRLVPMFGVRIVALPARLGHNP